MSTPWVFGLYDFFVQLAKVVGVIGALGVNVSLANEVPISISFISFKKAFSLSELVLFESNVIN